jgi:hypothetical protein
MSFLLPCPACGETTSVELGQAGGTVACACGASVDVPTMRELRALPQTEQADARAGAAPLWGLKQGLLLAGVLLLLATAIPAGYWIVNFPEPPVIDVAAIVERDNKLFDRMPVQATWNYWQQVVDLDLVAIETPHDVAYQKNAAKLKVKITGALALSVISLGLIAAGFLVKRRI